MVSIADPELGADERHRVDEILESGLIADGIDLEMPVDTIEGGYDA